jgi:hypothetical protein
MKTIIRSGLILIAGIAIGVLSTLWIQRAAKQIADEVAQQFLLPIHAQVQATMFCAMKGRPPKDMAELEAFSRQNGNDTFDPSKFVEIRFEEVSNETARMIWRLAPPLNNSGTSTVSWANASIGK